MIWQFDHRFSTYENCSEQEIENGNTKLVSEAYKLNSSFRIQPRRWMPNSEQSELHKNWSSKHKWLVGYRDITNSTNERTVISAILPLGNPDFTLRICFFDNLNKACLLVANFNVLVFDYIARQKIGGTHLSDYIMKQLPVIPPEAYTQEDIKFISSRVLELVYTSWDMRPFAQDMGYDGEPFIWNPNRRALSRAELDAYYAKLYGLTRDELRYILDPTDVYGADFPSETFRVLKNNEVRQFGEYQTQRLVLEAWDKMFGLK